MIEFSVREDGVLRYMKRWCVPNDPELKRRIMEEAHNIPYSVHPGGDKMYTDLKKTFWWRRMKREIAEFVAHCLVCKKVKSEHKETTRASTTIRRAGVEMGVNFHGFYRWIATLAEEQ